MLISLEGLPGAGKTTSAVLVAELLEAEVLCETTQDHPFLESIYDDERRYDLEVELAFLLLHAGAYRRISRRETTLADYSPAKDVLFAKDMLGGKDLDLWLGVYDHVYKELSLPDLVIFLRVPAEECLQRVRKRGRDFEVQMTLDRLRRMQSLYESHLNDLGRRVLTLDIEPHEDSHEVADAIASIARAHLAQIPNT
jgi:deoxyadenosine/deoxycytidine kinase